MRWNHNDVFINVAQYFVQLFTIKTKNWSTIAGPIKTVGIEIGIHLGHTRQAWCENFVRGYGTLVSLNNRSRATPLARLHLLKNGYLLSSYVIEGLPMNLGKAVKFNGLFMLNRRVTLMLLKAVLRKNTVVNI